MSDPAATSSSVDWRAGYRSRMTRRIRKTSPSRSWAATRNTTVSFPTRKPFQHYSSSVIILYTWYYYSIIIIITSGPSICANQHAKMCNRTEQKLPIWDGDLYRPLRVHLTPDRVIRQSPAATCCTVVCTHTRTKWEIDDDSTTVIIIISSRAPSNNSAAEATTDGLPAATLKTLFSCWCCFVVVVSSKFN